MKYKAWTYGFLKHIRHISCISIQRFRFHIIYLKSVKIIFLIITDVFYAIFNYDKRSTMPDGGIRQKRVSEAQIAYTDLKVKGNCYIHVPNK